MAYTPTMAAALSGATVYQLRHWRHARTGPLLAPEISSSPRVFYSFRDLLALRTFVHLRQNASLQKIRLAITNLRDLGELDHLAAYQLVSDRGVTSSSSTAMMRHSTLSASQDKASS
jgi:DNA-binding transcriptional MerR regulator